MIAVQNAKRENSRALVVVAKPAVRGEVKTRLCPPLTPIQAASLYECLLKDVVEKMGRFPGADLWVAFAPNGDGYFTREFGREARLLAQRGGDLGERLHHVFVDLFRFGYGEILITDSDSPTVPLSSIELAYRRLCDERCEVVLGPSRDGGYYLVGLKSPAAELFQEIPWSTAAVLDRTLHRASEMGLRAALLPQAYDIDVAADLERLWSDLGDEPRLQGLAPRTAAFVRNLFSDNGLESGGAGPSPGVG